MAGDGSNLVNLSNNAADDFDPAWSPDGSQIAFVSNRENEVPGQFIYVMNADGSNVNQLTLEDGSDLPDYSCCIIIRVWFVKNFLSLVLCC